MERSDEELKGKGFVLLLENRERGMSFYSWCRGSRPTIRIEVGVFRQIEEIVRVFVGSSVCFGLRCDSESIWVFVSFQTSYSWFKRSFLI
jgi:hypothetical protein